MRFVHFDMETNDFDDVLTLILLASTYKVHLVSVSLNCGTNLQVGLVCTVLRRLGRTDVVVGASGRANRGNAMIISPIHFKVFGSIPECLPDASAESVIHESLLKYPDLTILTGAWLTNIASFLELYPCDVVTSMYIQGGFAGCSLVPAASVLPKFAGRERIRTYNFCCDIAAAKEVSNTSQIKCRHLVSKNVCHGAVYDKARHDVMRSVKTNNSGLLLFKEGLDVYLRTKSQKVLHDPLMMLSYLYATLTVFREVELVETRGEWSSVLRCGTDTFISVSTDYERFFAMLQTWS